MTFKDSKFKRELGNGRWDRVLKQRMVALSEADNYDDAKLEWEATGNVWWGNSNPPDWVVQEGKCLCGHSVVYHFEIHNTITGYREAVGSDHINSYLIIREIANRTGLSTDDITDAMIEEWINVRVEGMKNTAWWKEHGDEFVRKFVAVRELDLRINCTEIGMAWTPHGTHMKRRLNKRRNGNNMASLVWRWNHPDNPKAQINTRGWPNKALQRDLDVFYASVGDVANTNAKDEESIKTRMEEIINNKKYAQLPEIVEYFGFNHNGYLDDLSLCVPRDYDFLIRLHANFTSSNNRDLQQHDINRILMLLKPPSERLLEMAYGVGMRDCEKYSHMQLERIVGRSLLKSDGLNRSSLMGNTDR